MSIRSVLQLCSVAIAMAAASVLANEASAHHRDAEHGHGGPVEEPHEMGGVHADHWMSPPDAQERQNPIAATPEGLADAAEIYAEFCALCHGPEGKGDGPAAEGLDPEPADLRQMVPIHTDGDLAWKIEHGRGTMPAWGGMLEEREIWQLVNYLRYEIAAEEEGVPEEGHGHEAHDH